jgi:hypothetical protein
MATAELRVIARFANSATKKFKEFFQNSGRQYILANGIGVLKKINN